MTTSDPAVEAAQRYWNRVDPQATPDQETHGFAIASGAAREALAPFRELHKPIPMPRMFGEPRTPGSKRMACSACWTSAGHRQTWPCDTARLIYREEELK